MIEVENLDDGMVKIKLIVDVAGREKAIQRKIARDREDEKHRKSELDSAFRAGKRGRFQTEVDHAWYHSHESI